MSRKPLTKYPNGGVTSKLKDEPIIPKKKRSWKSLMKKAKAQIKSLDNIPTQSGFSNEITRL